MKGASAWPFPAVRTDRDWAETLRCKSSALQVWVRLGQAEVDMAIRVLMQAGSYNESLRRRYEAGLSIKGLGSTDLIIKIPLAAWPAAKAA